MRFEDMTDRITLLRPKTQSGAVVDLEPSSKYDPYKTIWAKVEYLKGQEYFTAKAVNSETILRFIVRYRKDLDNTMAVRFNNVIYNINSVLPLTNKKDWTVIMATEVSTSG